MRTLVIAMALSLCTGCWVFDELDSGMEVMNQHTPKKDGKAKPTAKGAKAPEAAPGAPQPPPAKEGPGLLHELVVWTKKKLEGPPPPPDPQDVPVRCNVGNSVLFTTRGECQARGGQARELPPEP